MYLPLAGHFEKDKIGEKMSISSIGPGVAAYAIRPAEKKVDVHQENQKFGPPEVQKDRPPSGESSSDATEQTVSTNGCMSKISTEGFLILKAQTKDEPYAVLDKVIATMKENMEELGDAIATMKELT
jgi:hypothetical protein